ncbi:serine/threonine protein kinase [Pelomyxa schiedti]|nr:serine/threonine protein kinase [Pelomyxa schiedti]
MLDDLYTDAVVQMDCPPIGDWYKNTITNGWAVGRGPDLALYDSQWVGDIVDNGYILDVTDIVLPEKENYYKLDYYGQFQSQSYWGFGFNGDCMALIYRKDLFEKNGFDVPESWDDILSIAQQFHAKPSLGAPAGFVAAWCHDPELCYDQFACNWNQIAWAFGGELWDESSYEIEGVLDSPQNINATKFVRNLIQTCNGIGTPCDSAQHTDVINLLCNGTAAMGTIWINFGPSFLDTVSCLHSSNLSYAALPIGFDVSLGGQGLGIYSKSPNKEAAIDLFKWLLSKAVQKEWASRGGFSTRKDIIMSSAFQSLKPYNSIYSLVFPYTKDFWRLPEYVDLLVPHMEQIGRAAVGLEDAQDALVNAAALEQKIIDDNYPCGPVACSHVNTSLVLGVSITSFCTLVILASIMVWLRYFRHSRRIHELSDTALNIWKVDPKELTLSKQIGVGSFGTVYKGEWRGTDVAVKQIQTQTVRHKLDEFEREVEILRLLRHPQVVLFMAFGVDPEYLYIVTEYMSEGSLADILRDQGRFLSLSNKLSMAKDVAKGLNFLHTFDPIIIHCDIKPANLLVDSKLNCKVADFGMSIFAEGSKRVSSSVQWAAPEVLNKAPYTTKSDVYSYGISLWEIFTRERLYENMNAFTVIHKVTKENLRPVIPSSVIEPVAKLMQSCWSVVPDLRPSFAEILKEWEKLDSHLNHIIEVEQSFSDAEAPSGNLALVFTEVRGAATLWEWDPNIMKRALSLHNSIIRKTYRENNGYESKTEGESFTVVFKNPLKALRFCNDAQIALLNAPWDPTLLTNSLCSNQIIDGALAFRGLQVRMGCHYGHPDVDLDPTTKRMTYFGPTVIKTSKVASSGQGGQITLSADMHKICNDMIQSDPNEELRNIGDLSLYGTFKWSGFSAPETVYQFVPVSLKCREFDSSGYYNSAFMNTSSSQNAIITSESSGWQVEWNEINLLHIIGKGNFGEVWYAKWRGQRVAVKRLLNQKEGDSEGERYNQLKEIALMSELRHPNIVLFMGACLKAPDMCIITEFMELGSLRGLLDKGERLSWNQTKLCTHSIAQGMLFLHTAKPVIVHRDLKCANVLVNKKWDIKICDFGLSRFKSVNKAMTVCGTVCWAAPEVLAESTYTEKADTYSFSIVMWEMMTGKIPFNDRSDADLIPDIIQGLRPPLPAAIPQSYVRYAELMEECWNNDPAARPTFEEIVTRTLLL